MSLSKFATLAIGASLFGASALCSADVIFINKTGKIATDFHFTVDVARLGGKKLPNSEPWGVPWVTEENGTGLDVTYSWLRMPIDSRIAIPDGSTIKLIGLNLSDIFGDNAIYRDFVWTPHNLPATLVSEPSALLLVLAAMSILLSVEIYRPSARRSR